MKKLFTLCAALLSGCAMAPAQSNQVVTLTPEQLAKLDGSINSLVPLLPASFQPYIATALSILAILAVIGRVIVGAKNGGFFGAIAGLFTGTNTPQPANVTKGATQLANLVKVFLLVALPALILTGCAGTQFSEAASGSGAKMAASVPSPFGGGTIIGMNLIVGSWKSTTIVQPTNSVVTIAQVTRGQQNLSGSATNGAGITSGEFDATVISTGTGTAAITNVGSLNLK